MYDALVKNGAKKISSSLLNRLNFCAELNNEKLSINNLRNDNLNILPVTPPLKLRDMSAAS